MASLEVAQIIIGFFIAILLVLTANIDMIIWGWIIFGLAILIIIISFVNPLSLRFIFSVIGFSIGIGIYYIITYIIESGSFPA